MGLYLLSRIGQALVTLLIMTVIIFALARLTGDPTPLLVPSEATESDRQFFREQYGLDRSFPEQYYVFMRNVLRGEFGVSFRYREPALGIVLNALGPTLKLAGLAMLISICVGLPLGILSAVYRDSILDRAITTYASIGFSLPTFWVGLMLIMAFAVVVPILPSSGYGRAANYVLPVATLAIYTGAAIARLTRANMIEVLKSDFVHLQKILGLPPHLIVLKHALRNASLPIVTYLGLQFGLLLGGTIVTERVFSWPGIGQTVVEAILGRDYPVVQASVLCTAVLFMAVNLAVDVVCLWLDPRSRQ